MIDLQGQSRGEEAEAILKVGLRRTCGTGTRHASSRPHPGIWRCNPIMVAPVVHAEVPMRRAISMLLTAVSAVTGLRADALTDLTAKLRALKAQAPITLKLEQSSTEWDEGKERKEVRTLKVAEGPGGLAILEDSGRGSASRPAKAPGDPTGRKGETTWRRQLRAQEDLLDELEKATLVGETPEVLDGRPVRRLRLKLNQIGRAHV